MFEVLPDSEQTSTACSSRMPQVGQTSSHSRSLWTPRSQSQSNHSSMETPHWCPGHATIPSSSWCVLAQLWWWASWSLRNDWAARSLLFGIWKRHEIWWCTGSGTHELYSRWRCRSLWLDFRPIHVCLQGHLAYLDIAQGQQKSSLTSPDVDFLAKISR